MKSFFVTGTDTGVGKTVASTALLHALRRQGMRVAGMKPLASGCVESADGWRNEDALSLQSASEADIAYADINPYALPLPLAPEIAAKEAGVEVSLPVIQSAFQRLQSQVETVVVEGVGGWAAPLSSILDQCHVVRALQLPVVMVVGLRLGCLNHARLTARAIAADGAQLIGWVANEVDPAMERRDENFELLRQRLPVPCWGCLPWQSSADALALSALLKPQA